MGRGASRESGSQLTFSQLRVRVRRSELTFSQVPCVSIQVTLSQVSRLNLGYAQCGTQVTAHGPWPAPPSGQRARAITVTSKTSDEGAALASAHAQSSVSPPCPSPALDFRLRHLPPRGASRAIPPSSTCMG